MDRTLNGDQTDVGQSGAGTLRTNSSGQRGKIAEAQKALQMLGLEFTYAHDLRRPWKKCHLSFTRGVDGQMGLPYNPAR